MSHLRGIRHHGTFRILLPGLRVPDRDHVAAQAQGSPTDADLRCLAVMAKINQLPDPRHQLESLIGGYLLFGPPGGRSPTLIWLKLSPTAYAKMSAAVFFVGDGKV